MSYGYSLRLVELNNAADSSRLGVQLGRLCISKNVPVVAIAKQLGVSKPTVYNWFVGATAPQSRHIAAVAESIARLNRK